MEQTEILEGNKLIANSNFASDEIIDMLKDAPNRPDKFYINYSSYHDDWGLLMPVVEKIWALQISGYSKEWEDFCMLHIHSKIEAVWLAVVDFIKWHNENK